MDNEKEQVVTAPEDGIQDEEVQEVESSTTETQDEEATSEQATETPFHEHPRFQELVSEKNELKEELALYRQKIFDLTNAKEQPAQEVKQDLPQGQTPEEREFWNNVRKFGRTEAERMVTELKSEFQAREKALLNQVASITANEFLKSHPDVKRGSAEMKEIAQIAREKNIDLDSAYRIAMFDRAQQTAVSTAKKKQQAKTKEKLAAQVETKGVAKDSSIVSRTSELDDVFNKALDEAGADFS